MEAERNRVQGNRCYKRLESMDTDTDMDAS